MTDPITIRDLTLHFMNDPGFQMTAFADVISQVNTDSDDDTISHFEFEQAYRGSAVEGFLNPHPSLPSQSKKLWTNPPRFIETANRCEHQNFLQETSEYLMHSLLFYLFDHFGNPQRTITLAPPSQSTTTSSEPTPATTATSIDPSERTEENRAPIHNWNDEFFDDFLEVSEIDFNECLEVEDNPSLCFDELDESIREFSSQTCDELCDVQDGRSRMIHESVILQEIKDEVFDELGIETQVVQTGSLGANLQDIISNALLQSPSKNPFLTHSSHYQDGAPPYP